MDKARTPEDLTRLFVERCNAGDADGVAQLYEEDAVMAYPPGEVTTGREAIRELWEAILQKAPRFAPETSLPTLRSGDLADLHHAQGRSRSPRPGRAAAARRQLAPCPRPAGVHAHRVAALRRADGEDVSS